MTYEVGIVPHFTHEETQVPGFKISPQGKASESGRFQDDHKEAESGPYRAPD